MGWFSLILVSVVLMHHGTLKPNPLDDLTVNLNLSDAPNGGHTFGSHEIESKEWKTGKTTTKDSSCTKKRNEKRKRILGGERYIPHRSKDVPDYENWMASIKSGNQICGGVLVSPQHVLTALHCVFNVDVNKFYSFDNVKIYFDPDRLEIFKLVEFKPAKYFFVKGKNGLPEYMSDPSLQIPKDDIAVIKLGKPVTYFNRTASLRPLSISTIPGKMASKICEYWFAGWGIFQLNPWRPSRFLQYTKNIPYMDCPEDETIRKDTAMCFKETNKDATCPGDSGSPGVIKLTDRWVVQSVVSGGDGNCTEPLSMVVNTDVYQYRARIKKWIKKKN